MADTCTIPVLHRMTMADLARPLLRRRALRRMGEGDAKEVDPGGFNDGPMSLLERVPVVRRLFHVERAAGGRHGRYP